MSLHSKCLIYLYENRNISIHEGSAMAVLSKTMVSLERYITDETESLRRNETI